MPDQAGPKQHTGTKAPKPDLHPNPPRSVPDAEITAAIEHVVAVLIGEQNADGSWGRPNAPKS